MFIELPLIFDHPNSSTLRTLQKFINKRTIKKSVKSNHQSRHLRVMIDSMACLKIIIIKKKKSQNVTMVDHLYMVLSLMQSMQGMTKK
jgi:hypothetical protein